MYKVLKDCKCSIDGLTVLAYKSGDTADIPVEAVKMLGDSVKSTKTDTADIPEPPPPKKRTSKANMG